MIELDRAPKVSVGEKSKSPEEDPGDNSLVQAPCIKAVRLYLPR